MFEDPLVPTPSGSPPVGKHHFTQSLRPNSTKNDGKIIFKYYTDKPKHHTKSQSKGLPPLHQLKLRSSAQPNEPAKVFVTPSRVMSASKPPESTNVIMSQSVGSARHEMLKQKFRER
jgi:hypothetical protein